MQIVSDTYLLKLNKDNRIRSGLRQTIAALSLVVVLIVFWCLKLTGITMAGEAFCGMDEHIHGDGCPTGQLICPLEETDGHIHDESCILRELICTQAEMPPHVHTEECLCYERICGLEEQEGHTHGDDCHAQTLICTEEEREGHTHGDACLAPTLICTEENPEHIHASACYDHVLTCGLEEQGGHLHGEDCYILEEDLTCGMEETEGHAHAETCFMLLEGSYSCGMEETEGHAHTEDCFYTGIGFGCGLTEAEGHIHTEECLTEQTELGCGLEAIPAHIHEESCYETFDVCPLEEHIHEESCYSDIYADLEDEDDWEAIAAELDRELPTGEMVASVAASQLGVGESTRNFEVDRDGVRRGITRYGQWYGHPYGAWSAMFVSFCLHYAGVEDLPANAGVEAMRLEWETEDLYRPWDAHAPRVGDLVFLLPEGDVYEEAAEAVAIITDVDETGLTILQGDVDGRVEELYLEADDPAILGYGVVPERSPYALMLAAPRAGELTCLAQTIDYASSMFTNGRSFVIYAQHDGQYYALVSRPADSMEPTVVGVPIVIEDDGSIYTDIEDPDSLLWNFTRDGSNYIIQSVATGRYLHPGGDNAVIYSGNWPTALQASGSGARFVHTSGSNNVGIRFNTGGLYFDTTTKNNATTLYFGVAERYTVWLDGTNGGLMSLQGSELTSHSVAAGSAITLPAQWKSPEKYSYTLKGWYDVGGRRYYEPGETVTVTENMLFYADWVAATYDIGRMNSMVVDTVSTDAFITTRVFDYNALFNTLSLNHNYTGSGSSASWTMVEDGTVQTTGEETLNFIFVDYDGSGDITYPIGRNEANGTDYTVVTPGLYSGELAALLFDPNVEVIGKQYLGTGDHLFQYGDDPADGEHYGYYYYDSMLNAASYNQSGSRFYVYDYLERTADAAANGSYADFLPLNSPYANTNGKATGSYTYSGVYNEHVGTAHVSYDSKYSDGSNSPNRVATNYFFGMATEMDFYLPSKPDTVDENGTPANQSVTGEDMVFEFSGDDDVWVLIDGELMLDIGGIHGVEHGSIDFSTGEVIVDGVVHEAHSARVKALGSGDHTLTMYYLERGSSLSNFKLRFNLSTRYAMTLRKEDTLTAHLLDGAQFAVYTSEDCTEAYAAELWTSKRSHDRGDPSTNVFTVEDGQAEMWGLAAGNTYYLVEVRGPDAMQGVPAQGIIRMRLNNDGLPDYEVLPDHGNLTVGYTVHGYKLNEEQQEAYLVITNTDAADSEPTEISVEKVWNDSEDHRGDAVTAYLVANGVRIQSVTLSADNGWKHTWVNLPSADRNGTPVIYTVHEATFPGYVSRVTAADAGGTAGDSTIIDADGFENGKTYLLYTKYGYIGAADNALLLQSDADHARNSGTYLWTATVHSDGRITLTNKLGQVLYWDNYMLRASATPGTNRDLYYRGGTLCHYISRWDQWQYPIDNANVSNNILYNKGLYTTGSEAALAITPRTIVTTPTLPDSGTGGDTPVRDFRITNTPIGDATVSLRVYKAWDLGNLGTPDEYEESGVEIKLLANGEDAGLTCTLDLRNGWSYTFQNLPQYDSRGHEIAYSVWEVESNALWRAEYGPVTPVDGTESAYETTVTNVYRAAAMLPETGSFGRGAYEMLGLSIILGGLGWYRGQKRAEERGER